MHPFRQAVESADHDAIEALLAEDVIFTSPVTFRPHVGRHAAMLVLRNVAEVFSGLHYIREITGADGRDTALIFRARVGDLEIHGCDFLHHGEDGLIDEFTVMVRPLSAANALAAAMGARLGNIIDG